MSTSWRNLIRPATIVALVVAAVLIARRIPLTIEVIVVAMLLAYGMNPIIVALSKKVPRRTAIAIVFAGLVIVLLGVALIVLPAIVGQMQSLFANSPSYIGAVQAWLDGTRAWLANRLGIHIAPSQVQNFLTQGAGDISNTVRAGLSQLGIALIITIDTIVVVFTAIVLSYFFLANAGSIQQSFLNIFPDRYKAAALRFTQELERVFGAYIFGEVILGCFCAAASFVGLLLAGSNYALLLGFLTGLLYIIPYLGVTSAIILAALFGLLQSWQVAVSSVLVIFIVTRIADIIVVPKVMSKSVGVSPMVVMLAVFAGGEIAGLWGLLLAIPTAAMLKVVWELWLQPWLAGQTSLDETNSMPRGQADA